MMRIARLLGALLSLVLLLLPTGTGASFSPISEVSIEAKIEANGEILITERRIIADPRQTEFLELLAPVSSLEILSLSDQNGSYQLLHTQDLVSRTYYTASYGDIQYVEWHDTSPARPQELLLRYRLKAFVERSDALEWYWPAITGSGGRAVAQFSATIELPTPGEVYLYAYGGEAGGVRMSEKTVHVAARNIGADKTFEWRLIVPRSLLPEAQVASVGAQNLQSLRFAEELRMSQAMERTTLFRFSLITLLMGVALLVWLYRFTVRRHRPEPDPLALSTNDLTSLPPAVIGWTYDAAWFDSCSAQLLYLVRRGWVDAQWNADNTDLYLRIAANVELTKADTALLNLLILEEKPKSLSRIAAGWLENPSHTKALRKGWLNAVGEEVPSTWFDRPSWLPGISICAWYLLLTLFFFQDAFVPAMLHGLVAVVCVIMVYKRRHLSALGESHIARWVLIYRAAVPRNSLDRHFTVPDLPPEYFLAVEVGDSHLERLMESEMYAMVKTIYTHLDIDLHPHEPDEGSDSWHDDE